MIEFIVNTWYDNNIKTKNFIYSSFRVAGIANKSNHSED